MKGFIVSIPMIMCIYLIACNTGTELHSSITSPEKTDTLRTSATDLNIVTHVGNRKQVDSGLYQFDFEVLAFSQSQINTVYKTTLSSLEGEEDVYMAMMGEDTTTCTHFFQVILGYPACGYPQYKYVFSIYDQKIYLVDTDTTFSDGGYGMGKVYYGFCNNDGSGAITSVIGKHDPDEKDEEIIISSYSDSCRYTFNNRQWQKASLTKIGEVIRTEKMRF